MTAYVIRRLVISVFVLLIVTFIVFVCMRLLPGDPLMAYLSIQQLNELTPKDLERLRHEFGLDRPIIVQYVDWMRKVVRFDLGVSILLRQPVLSLILERLPTTMYLGSVALIIGSLLGLFFGIVCALRRGTWLDTLFTFLANLGITMPAFWLGILLIYFLSLRLGWLPTCGYTSPFDNLWLSMKKALMPVLCLAVGPMAGLTRQTRSSMLEVIAQDYIRTAWAKGLREKMVVMRHALKNALIPPVTFLGLFAAMVFGGSVIIETVFNIPGMGRLLVNAVLEQDYQIVQGGVILMGTIIIFLNLAVDISYAWLDPRIRYR